MATIPETNKPFFAPQLCIPAKVTNIDFYKNAFGAVELMSFKMTTAAIMLLSYPSTAHYFICMRQIHQQGSLMPCKTKALP